MGDRVIIPLHYSQSQRNCIVMVRACASTICVHKSITLATVFCFSHFPPRHSWECHCQLTVWFGIFGHTEENPEKIQPRSTLLTSTRWEYQHFCLKGRRLRVIGWCCWTQVVDAYWDRHASSWHGTQSFPKNTPSCALWHVRRSWMVFH